MVVFILAQELCIKGAQLLHRKSSLVEDSANELINMLLEFEQKSEEDEQKGTDENRAESKEGSAESDGEIVDHRDSCKSALNFCMI